MGKGSVIWELEALNLVQTKHGKTSLFKVIRPYNFSHLPQFQICGSLSVLGAFVRILGANIYSGVL